MAGSERATCPAVKNSQLASLQGRQRKSSTERLDAIVNSEQCLPIGTFVSSDWPGTSHPVMDPEGYIGSVTDYWASLAVWSKRYHSTLEAAVIAKYRSHLGMRLGVRSEPRVREWAVGAKAAIESSSLLVDGKLLFGVELRLDRIDVRAAWLDEAWILVVAMPEDAPEPVIKLRYWKIADGSGERLDPHPPTGWSAADRPPSP